MRILRAVRETAPGETARGAKGKARRIGSAPDFKGELPEELLSAGSGIQSRRLTPLGSPSGKKPIQIPPGSSEGAA